MTTEAACAELVSRLKRIHVLGTVNGLLGWDEQVNLPPDSADLRAEQLALMAEVQHAAASARQASGPSLPRGNTSSTVIRPVVKVPVLSNTK